MEADSSRVIDVNQLPFGGSGAEKAGRFVRVFATMRDI